MASKDTDRPNIIVILTDDQGCWAMECAGNHEIQTPRLDGDLSAGSGYNALARDKEYAATFLNEFQDRLLFGTDICSPDTLTPLVDFLMELKHSKLISEEVFKKIARENAIKLLGLQESI